MLLKTNLDDLINFDNFAFHVKHMREIAKIINFLKMHSHPESKQGASLSPEVCVCVCSL
jgi:hypothetical protein